MMVEQFRKRHWLTIFFVVINGLILLRLVRYLLTARRAPGTSDASGEGDSGIRPHFQVPEAATPAIAKTRRAVERRVPKKRLAPPHWAAAHRQKRSSRMSPEKVLLAVEVGAVLAFVVAGIALWQTRREVNAAYRSLQQTDPRVLPTLIAAANPGMLPDTLAQASQESSSRPAPPRPTPIPTATPYVQAVAAKPMASIEEKEGAAGEQAADAVPDGNIQWGTTVVMQKRVSERDQARRLQIPAISVDSFVFQDYGADWLKLGVVQIGEVVAPGDTGNMVLAAHNDIYGEVFRDLDELQEGDDIFLLGDSQSYTYRVREIIVVEPDDVWVTLPTSTPTMTLVSCYPYLVGSHRIVVFADLVQ